MTRIVLQAIFGLLILLGILASIDLTFRRTLDPDMFHAALVWRGVEQYGWQWINEWRFTQDNWIFSLVPFQVLLIKLSGLPVEATIFSGWLIFFLAAGISAMIARQLGGRLAPWVVLILLLWGNVYSHLEGFVSYPVSHNITNLYGLITVWLALSWINHPRNWLVGLIVLLQLMAGFSDPWLLPTFTLPLMLAGLVLAVAYKKQTGISAKQWSLLIGALILVFVLVKTRCFGSMTFMPVMHFALGNWETVTNNLYYVIRNIGGLYAFIYPVWSGEHWPETLLQYSAVSALIVVCAFSVGVLKVFLRDRSKKDLFFYGIAAFSVGGICAAYVISSVEGTLMSSRFVVNSYYLMLIGIVVWLEKNWATTRPLIKYSLVIVGVLYLASTAVSFVRYSTSNWYLSSQSESQKLIQFLDAHQLDYGYGPYHGARTGVVSVLTDERIKIRPVSFDLTTGQMAFIHPQTSPRWYLPEDAPVGQQRFFVYLPKQSFECPDYNQCYRSLVHDFGPPIEEISFNSGAWEEGTVLVWDHTLVNWQNSQPVKVALGQSIRFDHSQTRPSWSGWAPREPWGTWSDAPKANMLFEFEKTPTKDLHVEIDCQAYAPMVGANQKVDIYVNGELVSRLEFTPNHNPGWRQFVVPHRLIGMDRRLGLQFVIENPRSPKERNISPDTRQLGIGVSEIRFGRVEP